MEEVVFMETTSSPELSEGENGLLKLNLTKNVVGRSHLGNRREFRDHVEMRFPGRLVPKTEIFLKGI